MDHTDYCFITRVELSIEQKAKLKSCKVKASHCHFKKEKKRKRERERREKKEKFLNEAFIHYYITICKSYMYPCHEQTYEAHDIL
jgi:hypothetical protein